MVWWLVLFMGVFWGYQKNIKCIAQNIGKAYAINGLVVIGYIISIIFIYLVNKYSWKISRVLTKIGNGMKVEGQTLYEWSGYTQQLELKMREIIENEKSEGDIFNNIENLKNKLKNHFQKDDRKLYSFKAYLNVEEKDTSTTVLQTFIIGVISSIFVYIVVNNKISDIMNNFVPRDIINKLNESSVFYNASAGLFIFSLVLLFVVSLVKNTSKNRIRVFQEVTDIYIKELEKESGTAKEEAEARAKAEGKAKEAAEARAKAEEKAKEAAEARAKAEEKAKEAAEVRAKAEGKARQEAEARAEAEGKARQEAEARAEAEGKARQEAEARAEAEGKARQEAEARAKVEVKEKRWNQKQRQRCKHLHFRK